MHYSICNNNSITSISNSSDSISNSSDSISNSSDSISNTAKVQKSSKPLELWKTKTKKGCVRKVLDDAIKLSAIEIISENTSDSYIYTAPGKFKSLAISLPIIVLIVKNMNKYFSFRISIMDDKRCRRTFRISNFQTVTRLSNKWCTMPMVLNEGWNIIQINLKEYTEKAFKTKYVETIDMQINASIRIRCIYFCDKIYNNDELKDEFKIFSKKKEKIKYIPPQYLNKPLKKTTIKNIAKEKIAKKEGEIEEENVNHSILKNTQGDNKREDQLGGNSESPTKFPTESPTELTNEQDKKHNKMEDMTEGIENYSYRNEDTEWENKNDENDEYLVNIIHNMEGENELEKDNQNGKRDEIPKMDNNGQRNENEKELAANIYNEADISHITEIKNIEMDLNNVLYEDINYETYNNDDN
ncbi:transcription factor IIb, putative [Plasmodium malariae]|uniref:Transcription factor IIb, putative n=1 Tax=Plasmodium malariae TaxID=5858 RepID=A0A1A8W5N9_PLAMA|nr:transcription factor IIb, putative [Plasmodium malariae]